MTEPAFNTLKNFYNSYRAAVQQSGQSMEAYQPLYDTLLKLVTQQLKAPYPFQPYHQAIRAPFDYYRFGLELIRPLIDIDHSSVQGKENLQAITEALSKKENVILFSNHQTEIDPQIISLLLEKEAPQLAEAMIFLAGHRVTTDPLAAPLSMGCHLLCIFSKKYIDHPPEKRGEKLEYNRRTLKCMQELLHEGGKCIFVAPSGGRDRRDETGQIQVDPFDADSIEMLQLIAKRSGTKTHFHTLALRTYELLPPPRDIHVEIGEERLTAYAPAHLCFGPECEMQDIPAISDKQENRRLRAEAIWKQVCLDYQNFS